MDRPAKSPYVFRSSLHLGLVSALVLATGHAQSAETQIEEIWVSGQSSKTEIPLAEVPRSVSVVDAIQMERQNVSNLGQALRYSPGVISEPFGFEPRLTFLRLRGFDASETGLFRDGVKLSNPGFVVSYNLEPYGAEQIQVPRGPSSVLYGQTSPGGLIDYISKRPTAEAQGELELELGSDERRQAKLDVSGPLDDEGEFLYRITGLTRDSDTQVDFIQDDRDYLAPALTWNISADTSLTFLAHWQKDNTRSSQALPASGTLFDNPNGDIPLDRFTGEPEVDRYEREEYSAGYLFNHTFNDHFRFRQNLRYYEIELEDVSVFSASVIDDRTIGRSLFENFGELDGFTLDNRLLAKLGRHDLFVGVDYRRFDSTSLQFFGGAPSLDIFDPEFGAEIPDPGAAFKNEDATQEQYGIYVQDQISLTDRLLLSLGGRFDATENDSDDAASGVSSSQTDEEFVFNAGLVFKADYGLTPYLSYSESFLSVLGTDPDGEEFDPEEGEQVELGLKYQPNNNTLVTLALFDLTRENFTEFDPDSFLRVQTGEVNSQGIELEAATRFANGLELSVSYTELDVEVTESVNPLDEGEMPTQVPERMASAWANYEFRGGPLEGLGLGLGLRYLGESYGDRPNTLKVPDQTLVDLELHYDWGKLRFKFNAQNLLDEEYIASAFVRGGSEFATFGPEQRLTGSVAYHW